MNHKHASDFINFIWFFFIPLIAISCLGLIVFAAGLYLWTSFGGHL